MVVLHGVVKDELITHSHFARSRIHVVNHMLSFRRSRLHAVILHVHVEMEMIALSCFARFLFMCLFTS